LKVNADLYQFLFLVKVDGRSTATIDHSILLPFLANVNVANVNSRSLYAIARPSVVCDVGAPYSGGSNFQQFFYGVEHPGHPLTCTENFMEIVPGEPLRQGS